ncbi:glycosyltransferase family 2 protein [Desulfobacter sp. UBA2225]|uniref:glycosyltransferase family 2 protein n=1 Tax=Desulfobacter sp. UBA2225 TaxID=1961413 RepID=UPI00257CA20F|nr:glycosyltransferase family 2 protein [Desulfobacter sp. UBA2225]
MEAGPLISIVIPLYNKEQYIERTVRSVLAQTYENFELIVVDDGSTDFGPDIVRNILDERLRLVVRKNGGVSAARNTGIHEARADYVAFLDADDEWLPDFLLTVVGLIRDYPAAKTFITNFIIVKPDGSEKIISLESRSTCLWHLRDYIMQCVAGNSVINARNIVTQKFLLDQIKGFPVGQSRGEDLDTWFRLLEMAPAAYCRKPLAVYNYNLPGSITITNHKVNASWLLSELTQNLKEKKYDNDIKDAIVHYLAWRKMLKMNLLYITGQSLFDPDVFIILRSPYFRYRYFRLLVKSLLKRKRGSGG